MPFCSGRRDARVCVFSGLWMLTGHRRLMGAFQGERTASLQFEVVSSQDERSAALSKLFTIVSKSMSQPIAVNKRTKDYSLLRSCLVAIADPEIKSKAKQKHTSALLSPPWLIRSVFITHAQNVRMDSFHCLCLLFVLLRSSICEGVKRPKFDPVKAICDCNIVYVIHDVIMFSLHCFSPMWTTTTTIMVVMMTQFLHIVKYDSHRRYHRRHCWHFRPKFLFFQK